MTKHHVLALIAAAMVAAGAFGAYQLGVRRGMQALPLSATVSASSVPEAAAKGTDKKPLYWHDPMVPGQRFDKPGKSPFMDMQLVPVYGGSEGDDGTVSISPRVQQNLGVRTALVTTGRLSAGVSAVGSVAYNEREVALVQARSHGFVERLHVRAPLDFVRKGQALAELYVPDWIAAQEEFLAVRRMQGSGMAALVDAARQRMRLAGMSAEQVGRMEASGKVQSRVTLTAPVSGVITELNARDGMTVAVGAQLFRINGVSSVWVNGALPENVAARIRPGDAVEARTLALPGSVFRGKVGAIVPEVNAATRTLTARMELANPDGKLVPGMFVSMAFASSGSTDVLLIPSEAVIQTGTRSVVMLAQDGGKFVPVEVELGIEHNGQSEIRKGLTVGQKIVVSGQFLIDSEASLKGAATRMLDTVVPKVVKAAPTTPAAELHHGEGKLERISATEVTISHGPIASLQWGPMTMPFALSDGMVTNVSVGQQVSFDFSQRQDGKYEIVAISALMVKPGQPTGNVMQDNMKMAPALAPALAPAPAGARK